MGMAAATKKPRRLIAGAVRLPIRPGFALATDPDVKTAKQGAPAPDVRLDVARRASEDRSGTAALWKIAESNVRATNLLAVLVGLGFVGTVVGVMNDDRGRAVTEYYDDGKISRSLGAVPWQTAEGPGSAAADNGTHATARLGGALGCRSKKDLDDFVNAPGGLSDADLIRDFMADGRCRMTAPGEPVRVIVVEPLTRYPYRGARVAPLDGTPPIWTNADTVK